MKGTKDTEPTEETGNKMRLGRPLFYQSMVNLGLNGRLPHGVNSQIFSAADLGGGFAPSRRPAAYFAGRRSANNLDSGSVEN